jgi:hypothetical protein
MRAACQVRTALAKRPPGKNGGTKDVEGFGVNKHLDPSSFITTNFDMVQPACN